MMSAKGPCISTSQLWNPGQLFRISFQHNVQMKRGHLTLSLYP